MKKHFLFIVLFSFGAYTKGQNIVIDYKCIEQVTENATIATGEETIINSLTDSAKKTQSESAITTTAIQASVTLYKLALMNVDAFHVESRNIVEIGRLARLVGNELMKVTEEVKNNPNSTITSYNAIQNISSEAIQCVGHCVSLVSNNSITIPGFTVTSNDSYNYLDARQRIELCNQIIFNLKDLYSKCILIRSQIQYANDFGRIFQDVLPFDNYMSVTSSDIADNIINSLNRQ